MIGRDLTPRASMTKMINEMEKQSTKICGTLVPSDRSAVEVG